MKSRLVMRRGRSTGSTKPGEWIADFLVKYINRSEPDPYDFTGLLPIWASREGVQGVDGDTAVDELDNRARERFTRWLLSREGNQTIMRLGELDPSAVPSYVMMADARRLSPGAWLIHFTDRSPFSSFTRGATLATPLWKTGVGNPSAVKAKCPDNLSDKRGLDEVVFSYAFSVRRRIQDFSHHDYGSNAVLFRSDLAVEVQHVEAEEAQVIFPVCSEYDAIPIYGTNRRGGGEVMTIDGEMDFESAGDIIKAFDDGKIKREGRALGTTRKGRWHPFVALPRAR